MELREQILAEVAEFTKRTGLSESTVGGQSVKDSRFIARIRDGKGVSLHNIDRLLTWMRAYQSSRGKGPGQSPAEAAE